MYVCRCLMYLFVCVYMNTNIYIYKYLSVLADIGELAVKHHGAQHLSENRADT